LPNPCLEEEEEDEEKREVNCFGSVTDNKYKCLVVHCERALLKMAQRQSASSPTPVTIVSLLRDMVRNRTL